jgi:hypothetical protein
VGLQMCGCATGCVRLAGHVEEGWGAETYRGTCTIIYGLRSGKEFKEMNGGMKNKNNEGNEHITNKN